MTTTNPTPTITITFGFSESPRIEEGFSTATIGEADALIRFAAWEAPKTRAYRKTDITITAGDDSFGFRMDVVRNMTHADSPVFTYLVQVARYYRTQANNGSKHISDDLASKVRRIVKAVVASA